MSQNIRPSLRKRVLREKGDVCDLCSKSDAAELHHIDGDASNDTFENLLPVCRPCHMDIHYSRTELGEQWNEKILPRDERKTGDELGTVSTPSYDETFICSECGHTMPAYNVVENCPDCDAFHSLGLDT